MLEVCFSDSVKGSLTIAQNCDKVCGVATAVISGSKGLLAGFAKRKALKAFQEHTQELQKKAVPLGGNRDDIVSLPFQLSEGDILAPITYENCPRKDFIYSQYQFYLFALDRNQMDANLEETFRSQWGQAIADLEKLKSCPDKIRIWVDNTPDARCGLLFIADMLKDSDVEIHVVELPEKIQADKNSIISYRGWGEVEPELFGTFLDRERTLTEAEIMELSRRWEALSEENAPLRVYENGTVRSVPETYYDNLIRQEFPKDACKVAIVIGNALGRRQIPTGDAFIARRVQQYIHSGELEVVQPGKGGFYNTVVRSSQKELKQE